MRYCVFLAVLLVGFSACNQEDPDRIVIEGDDVFVSAAGCREGQTVCDGRCVDVQVSNVHCGRCRNECPTNQICNAGRCDICTNKLRTVGICDDQCVNFATSNEHCGGCFNRCFGQERCDNGGCRLLECATPTRVPCRHRCVDVNMDRFNCGSCDHVCRVDQVCVRGLCGRASTSCIFPFRLCADECVDPRRDNDHCGVCFNRCDTVGGETCQDGLCSCPPGWQRCSGHCVNPLTDRKHCGGCGGYEGVECSLDEECYDGICLQGLR